MYRRARSTLKGFGTAGLVAITLGLTVGLAPAGVGSPIPEVVAQQAGLDKLSPAERAVLDAWIAGQLADAQQAVAQAAASDGAQAEALPRGDDAFGVEQVQERVARIFKDAPERIESAIDGRLRGWRGNTVFRLKNGQVWQQVDNSRISYNLDDAEVVIFRGAMGTYLLKPKKLNSNVRVRRLE